jgi:RimJ/RimL family protein N-acetyltransferase
VAEIGNIYWGPDLSRTPGATEAMYLFGKTIFDLGYRRYEWKCNNNNEPSKRAAERFGFTFEGIFRQHMIQKGQNRDTAWFSMLDSEWPALEAAYDAWLDPANFDETGKQKRRLQDMVNGPA